MTPIWETRDVVLDIPIDHPAFAGHFPGQPIVPGVVLIDAALHAMEIVLGRPVNGWQLHAVKFLSPALPGDALLLTTKVANGQMRFTVTCGDRTIATGNGVAEPFAATTDSESDTFP